MKEHTFRIEINAHHHLTSHTGPFRVFGLAQDKPTNVLRPGLCVSAHIHVHSCMPAIIVATRVPEAASALLKKMKAPKLRRHEVLPWCWIRNDSLVIQDASQSSTY